ncbi:MAG: fcf [Verrucomicrobiaceae bacterium]|nr:fcf [Verrucomicrobiaceae bacterium]
MDKHPHVLLTGGRGRVASAIRKELAGGGWGVDVCSRTVGEGLLDLENILTGSDSMGQDAIVHCAWSTVPAVAQEFPERTESIDLPLMERLIQRLKADAEPPLLVFMSTGAVYGPAPGRASLETDEPGPLGEYARGKLAAEALLQASGLPHCILRVSNIYSLPSTKHDRQGVISRLVWTAIEGGTFQQWGEHSIKDYLHSSDFARALMSVIRHRLTGVVNVASGEATELADLIEMVKHAALKPLTIEPRPGAAWDVTDNRLDITLLQSKTGWKPGITIEEGVRAEVARAMNLGQPQPE